MSSPEIQSLDDAQTEHEKCRTATNQTLFQLKEIGGKITDPNLRSQFFTFLLQVHMAVMEERNAQMKAGRAESDLFANHAAQAVQHLQEQFRQLEEGQSGSGQK